jgi:hypothetical protein
MKAKILKAQFNELCLGGMILDMNRVIAYSGENKMTGIEISQHGLNIQTEFGKPLVLNSTTIYGPGYQYLTTPADFIPFAHAALPKKSIAPIMEIVDQFKSFMAVGTLLAAGSALK